METRTPKKQDFALTYEEARDWIVEKGIKLSMKTSLEKVHLVFSSRLRAMFFRHSCDEKVKTIGDFLSINICDAAKLRGCGERTRTEIARLQEVFLDLVRGIYKKERTVRVRLYTESSLDFKSNEEADKFISGYKSALKVDDDGNFSLNDVQHKLKVIKDEMKVIKDERIRSYK